MGDFLSNMLNRHANKENIVRPRDRSIFETHSSHTGSFSSFSDMENSHVSPSLPISESREFIPHSKKTNTNDSSKDMTLQKEDKSQFRGVEKNSFEFIPKQLVNKENKPDNKERVVTERIVEKLKFQAEELLPKNENSEQEGEQLRINIKGKNILDDNRKNEYFQKAYNQFKKPALQPGDKPTSPTDFLDKILVTPKKEIHQQMLSNFKINKHSLNFVNTNDSSNMSKTPTIKIHIGRIDIKAVKQSALKPPKVQKTNKAGMSLEQFLDKRESK